MEERVAIGADTSERLDEAVLGGMIYVLMVSYRANRFRGQEVTSQRRVSAGGLVEDYRKDKEGNETLILALGLKEARVDARRDKRQSSISFFGDDGSYHKNTQEAHDKVAEMLSLAFNQ